MNQTVTLRPYSDADFPLYKSWLYAPHVAKWYHDPSSWLMEIEQRMGTFCWIRHFIVEAEGQAIGFCQYYEYVKSGEDWHGSVEAAGSYSLDYLIGEPAFLRRGFGKAIILALVRLIQGEEHAKRIIVQPELDNDASCRTFLSCGFCFDPVNELYQYDL